MKYNDITIASGKGGAGKTTIAVSLASYAARRRCIQTTLCDCDVEEPDDSLFLDIDLQSEEVHTEYPVIDKALCISCGSCATICQFNAIVMVNRMPLLFHELCHACRGCMYACEPGAVIMGKRPYGSLEYGTTDRLTLVAGTLRVREVLSPRLIRTVKERSAGADFRIIDAPPGSSCSAVQALSGASYAVLVCEPTSFGFHDFRMVYEIVREMGMPCGVVINRYRDEHSEIVDFCTSEDITVIATFPEDMELARHYSRGEVVSYMLSNHVEGLERIMDAVGGNDV
ncbi:MAG: P-loop NTPase [Spirochaetota bacterium]